MEEGIAGVGDIAPVGEQAPDDGNGLDVGVVVAVNDPLGQAGGAGGVHEHAEVVGVVSLRGGGGVRAGPESPGQLLHAPGKLEARGSALGVHDDLLYLVQPLRHRLVEGEQVVVDDHETRVGVVYDVGQLVSPEGHVHRHGVHPQLLQAEEYVEPEGRILHDDRKAFARTPARLPEEVGRAVGVEVHVAVADDLGLEIEEGPVP